MSDQSVLKPIKTRGGPSQQWTMHQCPFNKCPIAFPHERQVQNHMNADHARDYSTAHICCGRAFLVHDLRTHQQIEHNVGVLPSSSGIYNGYQHQMNDYAYAACSPRRPSRGGKPMKHACYSRGCTAVYDSPGEMEEHMKTHRDHRKKGNRHYHHSESSGQSGDSPQVDASVKYYSEARK
ncbi:hypothetical protein CPB85DRAFT_187179 [Mucidula mucida]|nr:hypothetical protein CPB85DRAFT_187179 [Mucidula mucida]